MFCFIGYIAISIALVVWFLVATSPRNRERYSWLIQDEPDTTVRTIHDILENRQPR